MLVFRQSLARSATERIKAKDLLTVSTPEATTKTIREYLMKAQTTPGVPVTVEEGRRLSRLALQTVLPEAIRPRTDIRRTISHQHDQWTRLMIFVGAGCLFALAGFAVNLNTVSLHRYYRNRIAQSFVCAVNGSGEESPSLSFVDTCAHGGPYHLISGTITVWRNRLLQKREVPTDVSLPETHIDGSESLRSVDSFLLSQQYCGSRLTGYVKTADYEGRTPGTLNKLDLADAIAISGAAVSPGNVSNPLVAALMLILNLRLGQWLPNPNKHPRTIPNVISRMVDLFRVWKNRSYYFVTDGGVHENLGLVELLKRRCRLIVCVDAGCDPQHHFADLARAISDVRVHDGIRIIELDENDNGHSKAFALPELRPCKSDQSEANGLTKEHFKVGRILYANDEIGTLVYIKPSLSGDESIDLLHYRAMNKEFPHQSTADQFYDPTQVEAYRRIGEHIGKRVMRCLPTTNASKQTKLPSNVSIEEICESLELYQRKHPDCLNSSGVESDRDFVVQLEAFLRSKRYWKPSQMGYRTEEKLSEAFPSYSKDQQLQALVTVMMQTRSSNVRERAKALAAMLLPPSSQQNQSVPAKTQ